MVLQLPCIDVYPPQDFKKKSSSNVSKAIFLNDTIWNEGSEGSITITFGTFNCQGCSTEAAWSYIGNQSNYFSSQNLPSMNLGFSDPPFEPFTIDGMTFTAGNASRNYCSGNQCWPNWVPGATVLHEFGHALGMLHEHQSNIHDDNPLVLDKDAIYDYYRQLGMGDQAAETNVIERYECDNNGCPYSGSPFDLKSIMLYAIPDSWVVGENPTYPNFKYSDDDKLWLHNKYPTNKPKHLWPQIKIKFLDGQQWQKYWVKYCIQNWLQPEVGINFIFDLPTQQPTSTPTYIPTQQPTQSPTQQPTQSPTQQPTQSPTVSYTTTYTVSYIISYTVSYIISYTVSYIISYTVSYIISYTVSYIISYTVSYIYANTTSYTYANWRTNTTSYTYANWRTNTTSYTYAN